MQNLNDFAAQTGRTNVAAFLMSLDGEVHEQVLEGWRLGVDQATIVRCLKQEAGVENAPSPNSLGAYLRRHYPR